MLKGITGKNWKFIGAMCLTAIGGYGLVAGPIEGADAYVSVLALAFGFFAMGRLDHVKERKVKVTATPAA